MNNESVAGAIKKIVAYSTRIETLLNAHHEFSQLYNDNIARLELVRRFAFGKNVEDATGPLLEAAEEAQTMADGAETILIEVTGKSSVEEARQFLVELKTVLGVFLDAVSDEFKSTNGLTTKSSAEIADFGLMLISPEN